MITHFDRENPVKNLPDAYSKGRESNNAKILEIEKRAIDDVKAATGEIYESLDIDKAYGKTLDLYGESIGQFRGAATDEQLLVLIKSRINRNFADGDHTSIVKAICLTFGCDPADVLLTELDEPCKLMLEGLPIPQINKSNIDIRTAAQIVNRLIPAGVYMEAMHFHGTFEFSDTEPVYDEEAGFGDEEQTIGGYLGFVSDSAGSNLPV